MLTVDVHTHFLPPEVVEDARSGRGVDGLRTERVNGQERLVHRQGFAYPVGPAFYDLSARLEAMTSRGVDVGILSLAPPLLMYWLPPSEGIPFCRRTNETLAAVQRESGGRLRAVATLPMQDPEAAAAELSRAVGELGLAGAEIGTAIEGVPLDGSSLRPVLGAAARLGAPLIVHPYSVGARPRLGDFYLTNLVGNPLETTLCAARLILSGTLDELPDLRLVLMHGGGYLPYQIGRLDQGHRVRPESRGCAQAPSSYLGRFYYDTITHSSRSLAFLVDLVGADHVLYGTDFPFDMGGGSFAEQLAGVDITGEDRGSIASGNAAGLFSVQSGDRELAG